MIKSEAFYVLAVAVFAVVLLVQAMPSETVGHAVSQPYQVYVPNAIDIRNLVIPGVGGAIEAPAYEGGIPAKENLVPANMEFYVNTIQVPAMADYSFLPIQRDRIRTFSGKFGPYPEDFRKYMYVELCSFVESQPEMFVCEKIRDLNYVDGFMTFARGYDYDEYIAGMAMRNFGAYYTVNSGEFGQITVSNKAIINLVY